MKSKPTVEEMKKWIQEAKILLRKSLTTHVGTADYAREVRSLIKRILN